MYVHHFQQKKTGADEPSPPEEAPFVVTIQYQPKKQPTLLLGCKQNRSSSPSIDLKRNSSLSNYVLDDCLQKHIHAVLAESSDKMTAVLPLPEDAKGVDRHDVGRIRREISRMRRTLQSHPGQAISGDDEDDDEYDEYDPDEEGPRPFNTKVDLEIDLPAPRSVQYESTMTVEEYGDICADDVFRKAVLDPILAMMKEAGCENPFQAGMTVAVQMSGLRVPGLREYLAKELHQMKVGGTGATTIAPVKDHMPIDNDVVSNVAKFLDRKLTMADLTSKEMNNGRVLAIVEPGTDLEDEEALGKNMFVGIFDQSDSWKWHQETAMYGMMGPGMSLGGMLNALSHSDEEDYYTDQEFYSDEEEDGDDE